MRELITRSLSLRLFVIFVLLAGAFVYGTLASVRWLYRADDLRELLSEHLALHVDYVRRDLGAPPDIERALAITERVPIDIRLTGPDLDWASDDDFPRVDALSFGRSELFSEEPDAWLDRLRDVDFARTDSHRFLRLHQGPYSIIVSSPKIDDQPTVFDLRIVIVGLGLSLIALGYFAVRWLFRPIKLIREGAARIGKGDFEHRITSVPRDELGDLAADVNAMAADVQAMLNAKRQLLLGISHELRSPLSRMRLATELLEDQSDVQRLRDEMSEMEAIISTLLDADMIGGQHTALNIEPVAVDALIEEVLHTYFERDLGRLRVEASVVGQAVPLDRARILLVLKNLIGNALRYSADEGGEVVVRAQRDGDELVLSVSDHGPGFAAHELPRIGEPFYRGDASRDRETGGTGLGLYLARSICIAHGGSLSFDPDYRDGARVEVRLPAG